MAGIRQSGRQRKATKWQRFWFWDRLLPALARAGLNPSLFLADVLSSFNTAALASMNQKTLIIVPTYDERENLPSLVKKIMGQPAAVEMLVVDDNSPDGTGKLADEIASKNQMVHVLHREEKNGLGRAYLAGFKWALARDYEFIFEMDGDFSHNPDDVPEFLKAAQEQRADLVLGSRYNFGVRVVNWPLKRLILSRSAGIYVRIITGMPFTEPTGGYKCFRRRPLPAIKLDQVQSNG